MISSRLRRAGGGLGAAAGLTALALVPSGSPVGAQASPGHAPPRGPNVFLRGPVTKVQPPPATPLATRKDGTPASAPRPAPGTPPPAPGLPAKPTLIPISDRTRGQKVNLGGKAVQLPPDAYIAGHVQAEPLPGASVPDGISFLIVKRGNSTASVSDTTGRVAVVREAPGEEGAFDFLKDALR